GRRDARGAQRRPDRRGSLGVEARGGAAVARPLLAERGRDLPRTAGHRAGEYADLRRLPWPPGHGPGLRRRGGPGQGPDARQDLADRACGAERLPRPALAFHRDPLSLAGGETGDPAGGAGGHRLDRRRGDHGPVAPDPADPRRAVPPRVDRHRARPRPAGQLPRPGRRAPYGDGLTWRTDSSPFWPSWSTAACCRRRRRTP